MFSLKQAQIALVILITALLFISFNKAFRLAEQPSSGDEPHYILMAYSLYYDHDLDLHNDYDLARYKPYYPLNITPHISKGKAAANQSAEYSTHNAGIPVLMWPFIAAFGFNGVRYFMILWAIAVVWLAFYWCKKVTNSILVAAVASLILVGSISFAGLIGYVFPDMVIAALLLAAVLLLTRKKLATTHLLALSVIAGALPWIHFKSFLYSAVIVVIPLFSIWRSKDSQRTKLILSAVLLLPIGLLFGFFEASIWHWYHTLIPTLAFSSSNQLFKISPIFYVAASLFDATRGFLSNNPAFVIAALGLPIWWRLNRGQLTLLAILLLPTLALQSTFDDWWGGHSPPGRYLIEIFPLLLPAIALAIQRLHVLWVRILMVVLVVIQFLLTAIYILYRMPWRFPGQISPLHSFVSSKLHHNLLRLLPSFQNHQPVAASSWLLACFYAAIIIGFIWYGSTVKVKRV